MTDGDIYRGGCAVLLQAILTQACRSILAMCTVADHEHFSERIVATAAAYVSPEEANTLLTSAERYVLLTALHVVCCQYKPYKFCRHQRGEFAAAVGIVLQDTTVRSTLLTALTELISRKLEDNRDDLQGQLYCALSTDETGNTAVLSGSDFDVSASLLLRVFPELGEDVNGNGHESGDVDISCSCPHEWFRRTLPVFLLKTSMGKHACVWRHASLLSVAFVKWRQRHGLRLLQAIASGHSCSSLVRSQEGTKKELQGKKAKLVVPGKEDEGTNDDTNVKDAARPKEHEENNAAISTGPSGLPEAVLPPPPSVADETTMGNGMDKVAHVNDAETLYGLVESHAKQVGKRTLSCCFLYWRDKRLRERCLVVQGRRKVSNIVKQHCIVRWRERFSHRRAVRRHTDKEERCNAFIKEKVHTRLRSFFATWRESLLVRQNHLKIWGQRCWVVWRCAFKLSSLAREDVPSAAGQCAVTRRLLQRWRELWLSKVADRVNGRRLIQFVKTRMEWRSAQKQIQGMAIAHERSVVARRVLRNWVCVYRLRQLYARLVQNAKRKRLQWAMTQWSLRWLRSVDRRQRVRTFAEIQHQQKIARLFHTWRRRVILQRALREFTPLHERRNCIRVWCKWIQCVTRHQRQTRDRMALTLLKHEGILERAAWCTWRRRFSDRQQRHRTTHEEMLVQHTNVIFGRRLLAKAWFAWKGRAYTARRRMLYWGSSQRSSCRNESVGTYKGFVRYDNSALNNSRTEPINEGIPNYHLQRAPYATNASGYYNSITTACGNCHQRTNEAIKGLRAERLFLRGVNTSQWKSLTHSRLFKLSGTTTDIEASGRRLACHPQQRQKNRDRNRSRCFQSESRHCSEIDASLRAMEGLPSDVEMDCCPSVDNSGLLV